MKAVLTGATGAVGSALVRELLRRGTACLVLVREGGRVQNLPSHPLLKVAVCPLDGLASFRAEEKYDLFYHFAWEGTTGADRQNAALQLKNVAHALDAVECASRLGCTAFVGAGSQAEFGRKEGTLREDVPEDPENGYGIAKLCAGRLTKLRAEQLGLRHVWTRILSVYGPRDGKSSMISSAIASLSAGKETPFTAGEQIWDYLYSEDAARALAEIGARGGHGRRYVLGSGVGRPLKEYIEALADALGKRELVRLGALPYAEKQVMHLVADVSPLKAEFGWEPKVSFREGIASTVRAFGGENP